MCDIQHGRAHWPDYKPSIKHKVLMQQLLRSEGVYGLVVVDTRGASLACLFLLVIGFLKVWFGSQIMQ